VALVADNAPGVVAATSSPIGGGWTVTASGSVVATAPADTYGSMAGVALNKPIVGMAATPDGRGYWLVAADGGIFAFGDAPFWGSTGSLHLNQPVVGMAAAPDGPGYWLVAADGGIFAFGGVPFWGSTGGLRLNQPVVGMAATHGGRGYWLVAADGGVFSFGDAQYHGSAATIRPATRVVGLTATPSSAGYWLLAADGNVLPFGDANDLGSMNPKIKFAAIALVMLLSGYFIVDATGLWNQIGSSTANSRSTGSTGTTMSPTLSAPIPQVAGNVLVNANAGGQQLRLQGVDVSDTETACVKGWGFSSGSLDSSEAAAMSSWHVNAVRIPLNEDCWLGINGVSPSKSGASYHLAIQSFVEALNSKGIDAILDLHFAAPGSTLAQEQWPMPDADHALTFWADVAQTFKSNPSVLFDVYNEPSLGSITPSAADWQCWLSGCTMTYQPTVNCQTCSPVTYATAGTQQMVDTIRQTGAKQPILVAGLGAGSVVCTGSVSPSSACAWSQYEPNDPLHSIVASVHTYSSRWCVSEACWTANYGAVTNTTPLVVTELGEVDCTTSYVDSFTNWAQQHHVSYLYWAWQTPTPGQVGCLAEHALLSDWSGAPSVPLGQAVRDLLVSGSPSG